MRTRTPFVSVAFTGLGMWTRSTSLEMGARLSRTSAASFLADSGWGGACATTGNAANSDAATSRRMDEPVLFFIAFLLRLPACRRAARGLGLRQRDDDASIARVE